MIVVSPLTPGTPVLFLFRIPFTAPPFTVNKYWFVIYPVCALPLIVKPPPLLIVVAFPPLIFIAEFVVVTPFISPLDIFTVALESNVPFISAVPLIFNVPEVFVTDEIVPPLKFVVALFVIAPVEPALTFSVPPFTVTDPLNATPLSVIVPPSTTPALDIVPAFIVNVPAEL